MRDAILLGSFSMSQDGSLIQWQPVNQPLIDQDVFAHCLSQFIVHFMVANPDINSPMALMGSIRNAMGQVAEQMMEQNNEDS